MKDLRGEQRGIYRNRFCSIGSRVQLQCGLDRRRSSSLGSDNGVDFVAGGAITFSSVPTASGSFAAPSFATEGAQVLLTTPNAGQNHDHQLLDKLGVRLTREPVLRR